MGYGIPLELQAKRLEQDNKWYEAAQKWNLCGRKEDYDACMLIATSIANGDAFRNRVANELGPEPDKCENPRAWVKWYDGMTNIYNQIFRK